MNLNQTNGEFGHLMHLIYLKRAWRSYKARMVGSVGYRPFFAYFRSAWRRRARRPYGAREALDAIPQLAACP